MLLALDGVPVGYVVEADTTRGWIRRLDTRALDVDPSMPAEYRARCVAECPVVRVEGTVDYIGDSATDPHWMIAQRWAAVRIKHGLPIDASVAHDTGSAVAAVLERLASQIRSGQVTVTAMHQSRKFETLPLPEDLDRRVPTGALDLTVSYEMIDAASRFDAQKASWAREHPEMVAAHVRTLTEGPGPAAAEVETAADRGRRATCSTASRTRA